MELRLTPSIMVNTHGRLRCYMYITFSYLLKTMIILLFFDKTNKSFECEILLSISLKAHGWSQTDRNGPKIHVRQG